MEIKLNIMDFAWIVKMVNHFASQNIITQNERNELLAQIATEQNMPMLYL